MKDMMNEFIKISKSIAVGLFLGFIVLIIPMSIFKVSEEEQAVVTRFGKVIATYNAGLRFKVPFIDNVEKVNTTTIGLPIGYRTGADNDNSNEGLFDKIFSESDGGSIISIPEESLMITSDFNFVNVDFYLEYKVSDASKYLFASNEPESILRNIAQACIRTIVSNYTVDGVITTEKNKIQSDVKDMIVNELDKTDIGVQIVNISIQDAEPPSSEIMAAFEKVEQERQNKETTINNAKKYANEEIPKAEAEYDKIKQSAEANKEARISEAEGQVARFNKMYEEYVKFPEITKKRLFYETMSEVLPNVDLIVTDGNSDTILPLDSFTD